MYSNLIFADTAKLQGVRYVSFLFMQEAYAYTNSDNSTVTPIPDVRVLGQVFQFEPNLSTQTQQHFHVSSNFNSTGTSHTPLSSIQVNLDIQIEH